MLRTNTKLSPASTITITDPDGPTIEVDLLQCGHCGCHYPVKVGSGITRGTCTQCRPICGPRCAGKCVPIERWLENREQGKPDDHRPVRVSRGGIVLPY